MTKEQRKKAMPLSSAFVEQMRQLFGEPVYIKALENGH